MHIYTISNLKKKKKGDTCLQTKLLLHHFVSIDALPIFSNYFC